MEVILKKVGHCNNEIQAEIEYIEANISVTEKYVFQGTATIADLELAAKTTAKDLYQSMATANAFMVYLNQHFYYDPVADTLTPI